MTVPVVTLWEFTAPPPNRTKVLLTSTPAVNLQPVPFPTEGIWVGGKGYYCAPVVTTGVERAVGPIPSMQLTLGITKYVRRNQEAFIQPGTRVIRYHTDARALDGRNWADTGVNPWVTSGSPSQVNLRTDIWVIVRVPQETDNEFIFEIQYETAFWEDIVRPDIESRCVHKYRGTDCGYRGTRYWDERDNTVAAADADQCGLTLKSCRLRFPTGDLPFGNFFTQDNGN